MTIRPSGTSAWLVRGLYFFAFLLVFWPIIDLVTNTLPFQLSSTQWRYGFAGLLAAFLNTPILGLALATGVAVWCRDHAVLRTLAILELLCALGLVLVMVMFALDVVQVRAARPPASLPAFIAGAGIAEAKHFTAGLVLLLLGVGSWKTAAAHKSSTPRAERPGVVVSAERSRS